MIFGRVTPTCAEATNTSVPIQEFPVGLQPSLGYSGTAEVRLPIQHSIMDSFFAWQHSRENAEAAQQIQMEEARDPNIPNEEDLAVEAEHGDLTALVDMRYEGTCRIYRPNPARVARPILIDLAVHGEVNFRLVRRAIFRQWPDLTDLDRTWSILEVDLDSRRSTLIPENMLCFLIHVDDEVPAGHTVALNEYQRWRLHFKTFSAGLVPKVTKSRNDISAFRHFPDEEHRCYARPCVFRLNGETFPFPRLVDIPGGSFLVSADFDRTDAIHSIVGRYDLPNPDQHLPAGYDRLVGIAMSLRDNRRPADFHAEGRDMQHSLALLYHHLYVLWQGELIQDTKVLLLGAPAHERLDQSQPVLMFKYDMGDSILAGFPSLLEAIVTEQMTEDSWYKQFLAPHPSVDQMSFNADGQILLLRPLPFQQPRNMVLVEVMQMPDQSNAWKMEQIEMMFIFCVPPVDRILLLRQVDLEPECAQRECLLMLNGQHVTQVGEWHPLPDGSVLRVFIWFDDQTDQRVHMSSTINVDQDSSAKSEQQCEQTERETSSTNPAPMPPPPGLVGNTIALLTWIVNWICCKSVIFFDRPEPVRKCRSTTLRRKWVAILFIACILLPVAETIHVHVTTKLHRQGEASNPGPSIWVGTVNPTGIRGKEATLVDLPTGTWCITETHLSGVNMRPVIATLKKWGNDRRRRINCVPGAPLPLRARSSSAGTWAGVLTMTDLLTRDVKVSWPSHEHQLGRAQLTQTWIGPFLMTGACVYGWAKSPTWPNALRDTNRLFDFLVQEIGMSRGGPRYIAGDFNHDLDSLRGWEVLQSLGWRDSQDLANERWQQDYLMTCKGKTITDHVLLSPELVNLVEEVKTFEWFTDHAALGVRLNVPCARSTQKIWSLPASIPWDDVDRDKWNSLDHTMQGPEPTDLDARVERWAKSYEKSFNTCMKGISHLPNHCTGRCQRKEPEIRPSTLPLLRPSRPGEVPMSSESLGRTVQLWFKQLRRLQSLLHSIRAKKYTVEAQVYRMELWSSILRARGFKNGFKQWWSDRPTKSAGLPPKLPEGYPAEVMMEAIFHDFEINYRRLESWHSRQRCKVLEAQYQHQTAKVFEVVRKEPKGVSITWPKRFMLQS